MQNTQCEAERLGLKVGNSIFLLAGTRGLICKDCGLKCPYTLKDYIKKDYKQALQSERK